MKEKLKHTPFESPPAWARSAIWYQIFVERFYNGDRKNDPVVESIKSAWPGNYKEDWKITPWTKNWYADAPHTQDKTIIQAWYNEVQARRYGGDLQGIINKLDYIQDLGVNALYLNPINDAPSLHKYDARYYHHVDIHFGPNPQQDKKIIASENPEDPSTWKWTSADLLFLELIEEVHKRKMHLIIDFSWNHTGNEFWAWRDVLQKGKKSRYSRWYNIGFEENEEENEKIHFQGWSGVKEMPEFRKIQYSEKRSGFPYEGDLDENVKQHILNVTKRWLAPFGKANNGVDGFRMDVADQIGLNFWRKFRQTVRYINPEALLIGEIWWETWPETMMDPRPYLKGDTFDSIMFYQSYRFTRAFFAKTVQYSGAEHLVSDLELSVYGMKRETIDSLMMMTASHDTPRLLTSFFNKGKYKFLAKPLEDFFYKTHKPDEETYKRVKNFLLYRFTMPGSPQIWAGDEMGMWGADDPDCRKPLWWPEFSFEPETANPFEPAPPRYDRVGFDVEHYKFYKKIIALRKQYPIFYKGKTRFLYFDKDLLIIQHRIGQERVIVAFNNHTEPIDITGIKIKLKGYDLWNNELVVEPLKEIPPLSFVVLKK